MLTDRFIQRAEQGMHRDEAGLYLRVSPKGKKVWIRRDRTGYGDKWIKLGEYPRVSLAEARRIASGEFKPRKSMPVALAEYMNVIGVARPKQVELLLAPLQAESIDVDRRSLVDTLQKKAATAPKMANRMLTRWKGFFDFCVSSGYIESNPLQETKRRFIGGKEQARDVTLAWDEIKAFFKLQLDPNTKLALYFILATGLRPSEALWALRNSKLSEIPLKITPADQHPVGSVPPVPHVLALLKIVKKTPASHLTLSNALRRKHVGFKPHDLRRTFATRLSDLGVMPHVIEKLLHHKMVGVMAVYNHAEYWPEQVAAMKLWGRKLSELRHFMRLEQSGRSPSSSVRYAGTAPPPR